MELKAAIICDAASVREGLLHVLGGGITRIWRQDLPAALGVALAVIVDLPPDVMFDPHEVTVDPQHWRIVGRKMQVGRLLFRHQFKESVYASHAVPALEQLN